MQPDSERFTTFDRALKEYIDDLPKEKEQLKFIELCRDSGSLNPNALNELIRKQQSKGTLNGVVQRVFRTLIGALEDYSEVIGQLVSAQPLPFAIIWGALKVVVEGAARCRDMFNSMTEELSALTYQIQRMTVYDELYGDSTRMQSLFFHSYTNMISFWHRVYRECTRARVSTIGHSLTSSSSERLRAIVVDLQKDAENIEKEASLCQALLHKDASAKREKEYSANAQERVSQNDHRQKQSAHNYLDLCDKIRKFLTPELAYNTNSKRHESNLQYRAADTCDWLLEDPRYATWASSRGQAVLCLSGPVGYGKSVLSSFAIRDIESRATAAYYFCQFSQPSDSVHELLRLFALQLFNAYFARGLPVDDSLCRQVLRSTTSSEVQSLIRSFISDLTTPTYFFVDGLDEARDRSHQYVESALKFFVGLCDELPGKVYLWCSKRRQVRPVECYESVIRPRLHVALELTDHTEADVVRYLRARFTALETRFEAESDDGLDPKDRAIFEIARNYLLARAKGNFLWAQLKTRNFSGDDRVADVLELRKSVVEDPLQEINDLFKTAFLRIKPDDRMIASRTISLIAFARRQLRIEEIREVAVLLRTRGKKNGNDGGLNKMSLKNFLSRFTALVEFDKEAEGSDSAGSCRLFHSSVLEFLMGNPAVLGEDRSVHITPYTVADACLLYLSRPVYSKLLEKRQNDASDHDDWFDMFGRSIDEHHFAQYAAKYWARHLALEHIRPTELKPLEKRVADFVTKTNFQTCMQIQSLCVEGRFSLYWVGGRPSLLRVFPDWFIRAPQTPNNKQSAMSKPWSDYCTLLHYWQGFLNCSSCNGCEHDCAVRSCRGELDRLWYASLSPGHIFSGFQSRYTCFRLAEGSEDGTFGSRESFAALCVVDGRFTTLRLQSWDRESHILEFICERWCSREPSATPSLDKKQIIQTNESATNWLLYTRQTTEEFMRLVAHPTMFSEDGGLLCIGAQLFFLNGDGEYQPFVSGATRGTRYPTYFEEFSARGTFLAIGSRAHTVAKYLRETDEVVDGFGKTFLHFENFASSALDGGQTFDDDNGTVFDGLSDVGSDADTDERGNESWSEGSTDGDELDSDDSEDEPSASSSTSDDDSESAAASSDEDTDTSVTDDNSSKEWLPLPHEAFVDSAADADSDEEEAYRNLKFDAHHGLTQYGRNIPKALRKRTMHLTIFDTSGENPLRIFHYTHPLSFMLYESPPVIHPQKSLAVWPLGGGDVLFADFHDKNHFVRKLRASTTYTRSISMKAHFSPCGGFLHIASLEARTDGFDNSMRRKRRKADQRQIPNLRLSLFVTTYRLSSRKCARSPPLPIHRVKVDLGSHATIRVSRLPFTFHWTERDLFVTQDLVQLTVFRIALFRQTNTQGPRNSVQNVLMPKNPTFLPQTANAAEVHLVPSSDNTYASIVIGAGSRAGNVTLVDGSSASGLQLATETTEMMAEERDGSDIRRILSPPIGCFVKDEQDLGGWVRAEDVAVTRGRGAGKLDQRREKFDPVDDCDVEPYLRFV